MAKRAEAAKKRAEDVAKKRAEGAAADAAAVDRMAEKADAAAKMKEDAVTAIAKEDEELEALLTAKRAAEEVARARAAKMAEEEIAAAAAAADAVATDSSDVNDFVPCEYCGRTFFPDRLPVHLRVCKQKKNLLGHHLCRETLTPGETRPTVGRYALSP